jgi:hypothetical protein
MGDRFQIVTRIQLTSARLQISHQYHRPFGQSPFAHDAQGQTEDQPAVAVVQCAQSGFIAANDQRDQSKVIQLRIIHIGNSNASGRAPETAIEFVPCSDMNPCQNGVRPERKGLTLPLLEGV